MRPGIITYTLLIALLAVSMNTSAAPWRGHRHHSCYGPRPVVRIYATVPVYPPVATTYYGYRRPHHYYRPACHPHRYYHGCGYRSYNRGHHCYR